MQHQTDTFNILQFPHKEWDIYAGIASRCKQQLATHKMSTDIALSDARACVLSPITISQQHACTKLHQEHPETLTTETQEATHVTSRFHNQHSRTTATHRKGRRQTQYAGPDTIGGSGTLGLLQLVTRSPLTSHVAFTHIAHWKPRCDSVHRLPIQSMTSDVVLFGSVGSRGVQDHVSLSERACLTCLPPPAFSEAASMECLWKRNQYDVWLCRLGTLSSVFQVAVALVRFRASLVLCPWNAVCYIL